MVTLRDLNSPGVCPIINRFPNLVKMNLSVTFAMVLSFCSWTGSNNRPDQSTYAQHLAKGDAYYHAFDNIRALAEYRQSYEIAPDSFATLERMARIYNDLGRLNLRKSDSSEVFYKKALCYAESLSVHFPQRAESHFWLALCSGSLIPFLGVREKLVTARKVRDEASRAVELDSSFAEAYVILGILQRETSNIGWFERTIANVVFGAGFSGTLSGSEALLHKAVRIDPSNTYGYYELYWTYKAMDDSIHAAESLRAVLRVSPANAREKQQWQEARHQLALLESHP